VNVELRHLRYFISVAENHGFGRAALALNVSQSAISEQIADLESELGVALVDRQQRQIRLTVPGEKFLEDARAVIALANRAVENVRKSQQGEIGTLAIGFFVGGTGTLVPRIIKEFRRRYEEIHLTLVESAPALQHRALLAGTIDIAFTRPVLAAQSALLRSERIQTEPLYAVLPVTHRLAKKRSIRIAELADETFVLNDRQHSPVVFDKVITLCAQAEITPRIGATATVGSGVITLVEAGEGIAILPEGSRSLGTEALVFIPLTDSGASVDLVIAWSVQHSNPAVQSFVELIRKRRKKNAAVPHS
jgi:DNA-binding transcriptional LysR family regulator